MDSNTDASVLVFRNLQEIVGRKAISDKLRKGEQLRVYFGTATTGKPHLGYFVPLLKVADLLKAGCHVTVLFADLHAYLDNLKSDWPLLAYRVAYYKLIMKAMLRQVGVDADTLQQNLEFVRGTDFQLHQSYTLDMYKVSALVTTQHTRNAGSEVVKQIKHPLMSGLLYPILQALDEEHLGVDVQLGGVDQRKIFMFARETLPKLGYRKRAHLMTPLIPGLTKSGKMSASIPNSKIDFDDTDDAIHKKISKAFSVDKQVEGNALLAILRYIVLPLRGHFIVPMTHGKVKALSYIDYRTLEVDFEKGTLYSSDIKPALADVLITLVTPLRKVIGEQKELYTKAYPVTE